MGCSGSKVKDGVKDGELMMLLEQYDLRFSMKTNNPAIWLALGDYAAEGQAKGDDFIQLSAAECFMKALDLDRTTKGAWTGIANCMDPANGDCITVDGVEFKQRDCFAEVIRTSTDENRDAGDWYNLGIAMGSVGDPIEIHGENVTEANCFATVLNDDDSDAYSWCNLGRALSKNESTPAHSNTADVKGSSHTEQECYIKAIVLYDGANGSYASAWRCLAGVVDDDVSVTVGEQGSYTKEECLAQADA